jgi:hypothetical protein
VKRSEEFLKNIGPRELTREEREELRLLRIAEGDKSARALKLADMMTEDDKDDGGESGGVKSKFLK